MIAMVEGRLESLDGTSAMLRVTDGMVYQVLLPAFTAARLGGSIGQNVALHTFHYLEGQGQGATLIPRLAGFLTPQDRRFFELFTSVNGIGIKTALAAMTLDSARIAAAIADRDLALLQSLPKIGKRTAETIVATLSGKVDAFVSEATYGPASKAAGAEVGSGGGIAREALEVLLQLGENRVQAVTWIDQILREKDRPKSTDQLVQQVYRIKAGA